MKKIIWGRPIKLFCIWKIILYSFFLSLSVGIQAQNSGIPGKIRLKLTDEMAATFALNSTLKSSSGSIVVGTTSLNELHNQFNAKNYKRLFPHGGKFEAKHRKHGLHLWYEIDIDKSFDIKEVCDVYMRDASVVIAEPILEKQRVDYTKANKPLSPQSILSAGTNDPRFPEQWHYNNTGQLGEKGINSDISLLEAWQLEAGDSDIIVSVHDGGIHVTHEDLIDSMWINEDEIPDNGIDDDNNGYIDDINGYGFGDDTGAIAPDSHGTHVGGTIGATTNNNIGVSGIAGGDGSGNGVRLMSCAVFGDTGSGNFDQSYIYAADNGAVISQNSWGNTIPNIYNQSVLDAIRYFIAEAGYDEFGNPSGPMQGGIVIFASGNDSNNNKYYPGAFEEVIAVGSTDFDDVVSSFSNWGDWVDIGAPGNPVLSTFYDSRDEDNKYNYLTGTSMACPHVSGVAALIISKFKGNITPEETRSRLLGATDKMPYTHLGSGRLNALRALQDNDNIPPQAITDLTFTGTVQNTVSYSWTVPPGQGNRPTYNYEIRYATNPITESNYNDATIITQNILASNAGSLETFSSVLDVSTTYYIAIKAKDFFGNLSDISNVISVSTNTAPLMELSYDTLNFDMDVSIGQTNQVKLVTVNNIGDDILNYKASVYPGFVNQIYPGKVSGISPISTTTSNATAAATVASTNNFELQTIKKDALETVKSNLSLFENNVIVEDSIYHDDGNEERGFFLGNPFVEKAFAVRFEVDKPSFMLTHVRNLMDLEDADAEFLPIVIEIRKGRSINNSELLLSQEVMPDESERFGFLTVPLTKSQTFTQGDIFWIIHKFPIIYEFPQGVEDSTIFPVKPNTFFRSFNRGVSYTESLQETYITRAISGVSEDNMIVLSPKEGSVNTNSLDEVMVTCNVTNVPNGEYTFSLIADSDDPQQAITRIPSQVTVTGQVPEISLSAQLLEFDTTLLLLESEKEIKIKNNGLEDLKINFTSDNPYFKTTDSITISIGQESTVPIKFAPLESGIISGVITLATNDPNTPETKVELVGVALDPPVIQLSPSYIENTLEIGQTTTEKITISNTGNYPLIFSLPEIATTGTDVTDQSLDTTNDFEYSWMDSNEIGGPVYVWNDISKTGIEVNIGEDVKDTPIDLPFVFNFYGEEKEKVNIHSDGMLYFGDRDEPVRRGAISPSLPSNTDGLNDYIAVNYRDSESAPVGNIYYKLTDNALIVQYEQVGNSLLDRTIGIGTFQVVLLKSGNILFYYKDVSGIVESNKIIGIENSSGTEAIAISSIDVEFTLADNLVIMLTPKKSDFITEATQVTGVLAAGTSVDIDVTIDASNLVGGVYYNEILIHSNDPNDFSVWIPATLNVNGEQEQAIITSDELSFDNTFVGVESTSLFSIKNPGTANISIESVISDSDQFVLDIETPFELKPFEELEVPVIFIPTIATTTDALITITTDVLNSDSLIVPVSGTGISPPIIYIDSTLSFNEEAYNGEQISSSLTIKNEGESKLQFLVSTPPWLYVNDGVDASSSNGVDQYGYRWKDNKKDANDVLFNFVDIAQTGIDVSDAISSIFPGTGSAKVDIGFDFRFYDNTYNDVWISSRGLLYFSENQISRSNTEGNRPLPSDDGINNLIAGAWDTIDIQDGNVYYQSFEDYFVVQFTNSTFPGDFDTIGTAFTMQMILFTNGDIKFQYKDLEDENDTQPSYTIGIENEAGDDGLLVTFREIFIKNGLAVLIEAPKERFVEPGETTTLPLVFDAINLNKGEYTGTINLASNDPLNNNIIIPATFTVFGDAIIEVDPGEVDFGEVILTSDNLEPVSKTININNIGSDTLVIDAVSSDNDAFTVSFDEPISIAPSEGAAINVTSLSDSLGDFSGNLLITSNDKGNGNLAIPLQSKIVDAPILLAITKNDTIYARVKQNGSANRNISLINKAALGTLNYNATPRYLQIDEEFLDNQQAKSNLVLDQAEIREAQYAVADSLFYSPSNFADTTLGFDNESLTTATKFVVGSDENFELTHIRNYYDPGTSKDPITIKIYKGGEAPNEGQLLLTQQHEPQSSVGFELITLDHTQNIKAEETFWVVLEYPLSMERPQGVITDFEDFYYQTFYYSFTGGTSWVPMEFYFNAVQFQIRALGSKSIDWIELSPDQGDVLAGTNSDVNVQLNAAGLDSGTYYANINFNSNDPLNVVNSIPVRMTVNALPEFYEAPTDTLQVIENETIEIDLRAIDNDGEVVFYTLDENHNNVSFESSAEAAKISFTPDFTQSGLYTFTVKAFDDLEDYATTSFTVQVIDNNRPPILIKQIPLQFYIRNSKTIDLSDYIEDPDNDALSYIVTAIDSNIIELALDGNLLKGEPLQWGSTNVSIVASDGKGGQVGASYRAFTVPSRNLSSISTASKDLIESTTTQNIKVFNEPNPFQYETTIKYTVEETGYVKLDVFSFDTKLIETLVDQIQEAGNHEVLFDRKAISSGTYIYTIQVDNQIISKKMIIQ